MFRRIKHLVDESLIVPSSGVHLDAADGLRGVAILMVIAAHYLYANPNGPKVLLVLNHIAEMGTLGVPIFFVLSGFLLSIPFLRAREQNPSFWYPRGFALRRVLKIVPPFYLCIVVLVLINYWLSRDSLYFKLGVAWASGVAHFVWFDKPLNGSFWSLWVEIGFYATLPFFFLAVPGKNIKRVGWMIFGAMLLISFASRLLFWHGPAEEPEKWHFITSRFPASLDFFAWGIVFASLYLRKNRVDATPTRLALYGYLGIFLLVISAAWTFWSELGSGPAWAPSRWAVEMRHFLPPMSAFFLLFFIFDPSCIVTRFLASPVMRFLGIISYEWFLIHQPFQQYVRLWSSGAHGSPLRYAALILVAVTASLATSMLIYYAFSLPIMRWGRGKLGASKAAKGPQLAEKAAALR